MSEVLILGGGLAGASAALELARADVPVRLLERETGPHHKVCGEFLSIEAQHDLRRLGLDPVRLGAVPVDRVRLVSGGTRIEAALPFQALGLSRKCLDEALLEAAQSEGAQVERGVKVIALEEGKIATSTGSRTAERVFLATGKHEIRGARRDAGSGADYIGFKMHWRLAPRRMSEVGSAIELAPFDGGYAGLQCVAHDVLNLCLLVRRERFARLGGHWEDLLAELMRAPHLERLLGDAEAVFSRPLTIANLPYGYVCDPVSPLPPGVFRLGDQAAITAPLTGDGMAIATRSARLAVACLRAGSGPAEYHGKLQELVRSQVTRAMLLQRAVELPLAIRCVAGLLGLWPGVLGRLAGMTRLAQVPPM
ncbi:NAD(P)/FAD-dependent oxidoreductase [Novosphingobium endophyticum]|uniref:NAD(P)/FAD-dependent oxidoreductase n=1 Tax=Novosphingobium endophyticum TaxID=1955250 RepID=UPI001667799F|nr:FAD-dependent monooxygenase [Novosphingobium endophyticum]